MYEDLYFVATDLKRKGKDFDITHEQQGITIENPINSEFHLAKPLRLAE